MMKESITRTQKMRSESTPVDLERRASCSSLIGGYEGFKNLRNQGSSKHGIALSRDEYKFDARKNSSGTEQDTSQLSYNVKLQEINNSNSKYKLSLPVMSLGLNRTGISNSQIINTSMFEKSNQGGISSFNQSMNSVGSRTEETSRISKHADRFLRDFERIKD